MANRGRPKGSRDKHPRKTKGFIRLVTTIHPDTLAKIDAMAQGEPRNGVIAKAIDILYEGQQD